MRTAAKALALALIAATAPVSAMAWTRSYVVSWFEPAFLYGGPDNGIADTPGTDCPQLTEIVWEKELAAPYRSPEYYALQFSPEHPLAERLVSRAFRGPDRENVYENPTIQPDPGFTEVKGKIAEGIGRFNAVGWFYALRRNADGMKDPVTGQNRGISTVYRYDLLPAFVVSPGGDKAVTVAQIFER